MDLFNRVPGSSRLVLFEILWPVLEAMFTERQLKRLLDNRPSAEGYADVLVVLEQQLPRFTVKRLNQPAWPPQ